MNTADIDQATRFLQYLFVDGKFYTIFSILFGIGFAIILSCLGVTLFYRRITVLLIIGLLHLLFIWSGDILLLYAWSATHDHPWGLAVHSLLYAVSVAPLGIAYMLVVSLWQRPFLSFRWAGRIALTCYIGQSLIGILLFYGIGFAWGTTFGLIHIEAIALIIFFVEVLSCRLWFHFFRFGPLEWLWRMLTYGRWMPLRTST